MITAKAMPPRGPNVTAASFVTLGITVQSHKEALSWNFIKRSAQKDRSNPFNVLSCTLSRENHISFYFCANFYNTQLKINSGKVKLYTSNLLLAVQKSFPFICVLVPFTDTDTDEICLFSSF